MWRCALALVLVALALRAEIYRCEDGEGGLRFTGDPARCENAVPHTPRGELQAGRPGGPPREERPADRPGDPDLRALFAPAPAGWEVIEEGLVPAGDPELRAHGLRASQTRHYTRAQGPVSEVCSVEIWSFASAPQAAAVAAHLDREGWYRAAVGELLVVAHGARLERHVGSAQELVAGCEELAKATRARAAERRAAADAQIEEDGAP